MVEVRGEETCTRSWTSGLAARSGEAARSEGASLGATLPVTGTGAFRARPEARRMPAARIHAPRIP